MTTKLHSSLAQLAACILLATPYPASAQADNVTISAAEFQRMVYSAHLVTQLSDKPELDASLQVLLELHRRNPHADPAGLAGLAQQALARYRTNAPAFIRTNGFRDEILAAYLDGLRQLPPRTNFIPANLVLLNHFMLSPDDYGTASAAELIHSGNRRLLSLEGSDTQRQAVLDACAQRASGNSAFAAALDALLLPEAQVSCKDTPAAIISNTNSALHGNPTFASLLALSLASGNGSLTVSSNQLMALFDTETRTFWDTINTNLALQLEMNRDHPDLLAYLTNQGAIEANGQRVAAVKQGQSRKIAAATAAVLVQSKLMEAKDPLLKLPKQMSGCVEALHKVTDGLAAFGEKDVTKLAKIAASGNMLAGGLQLLNMFVGGESAEDAMAREIGNVKTLIGDLSTNMNYRFDRVDQSLTQIFNTLNERFDQIEITLDAQGRQIAHLNGNVDVIRKNLVDVQTDLHRLERHVLNYVTELYDRGLNLDFNSYLGYEATYGQPMAQNDYNNTEADFFTQARNNSLDALSSPYLDRVYTPAALYWELTESSGGVSNRLDQNLSYLKTYLTNVLGQSTAGPLPLPNPRAWSVGAAAYLQLATENPLLFRRVNVSNRLELITARGSEIANFLRSLTFTGTNINWAVWNAVGNGYLQALENFGDQVRVTEQQYAGDRGFAFDTWRHWSGTVPRFRPTSSEVTVTPAALLPPSSAGAGAISASWEHFLALRPDGSVLDYGAEADYGLHARAPAEATNAIAIAAGGAHSLILQPGGKIFGWGYNWSGQTYTPPGATNVVRIAAGDDNSLALLSDGRVIGWGNNFDGQATGVPNTTYPYASTGFVAVAGQTLSNVVAIAASRSYAMALRSNGTIAEWGLKSGSVPPSNVVAITTGGAHSLALTAEGTVVGWGDNYYGQTNTPASATNVVAIAAGDAHSVALRADGTVLAWGYNYYGQTNVPPHVINCVAIAAGGDFSVALRADGTVIGWGKYFAGHAPDPNRETNLKAIAAGLEHNLALRVDGTVVGWGDNSSGEITIPDRATNVTAIAVGYRHSVALRSDRTVVAWGANDYEQVNVPATATNVTAIVAGFAHNLALRSDGTVVGWGYNSGGQATIPNHATNMVAVAAGFSHSLALRADGVIVAWGANYRKQTAVPASASNVVAIAAGDYHNLALRSDGTVVGWGDNGIGQTNIPASATNVVAIAAGGEHSLALRADGTAVAWGGGFHAQTNTLNLSNVIAIAAGGDHSLFLTQTGTVGPAGTGDSFVLQANIPSRVGELLLGGNTFVLTNLDVGLHSPGLELSGARALLTAVLELGLPYTLERDDVLHGFLYGSEPLMNLEASRSFLEVEGGKLKARFDARPQGLRDVAVLRYLRFSERLRARLNDLQAEGHPELPRLVAHTLSLCNLLRDAWNAAPAPALDIARETNSLRVVLYGEPYAHYNLQYRDSFSLPAWVNFTNAALQNQTNLHNEEIVTPLMPVPSRFYRAWLPAL